MHYLIFLPKRSDDNVQNYDLPSALKAHGLEDHVVDAMPNQCHCGPDGEAGFIIGWGKATHRLEYKPEEQTWRKSVKGDGYWVGIWDEDPPVENELRRHHFKSGEWVSFGEMKWMIPTPKSVDQQAVYNDDGTMRWVPLREFNWLVAEVKKLRDEYIEEWDSSKALLFNFEPTEFVDWLLRLLRVNYRIVPEVAVHLGMWHKQDVLNAVLNSLELSLKSEAGDG